MTIIHARLIGDKALLPRDEFERLLELARQNENIEIEIRRKTMALSTLQERVYQEIERLSDRQLREVLLFIEFLGIREDKHFIDYVNERTQQALDARKRGEKFDNENTGVCYGFCVINSTN